MKQKILNGICGLCFLLLAGTAAWTVWQITSLGMLSAKYLTPVLAVIVLLVLLLGFFLLPKRGKKERKAAGRIAACVLSVLSVASLLYGATAIYQVNETVDAVTTTQEEKAVIEAFAMKEGGPEALSAELTFGWSRAFDGINTEQAIRELEEKLGSPLKLEEYPSMLKLVDALYDGSVDCVLMNTAYQGVLEGLEEYGDFSERTAVLHTVVTVRQPKPEPKPVEPEEEPEAEPEPEPRKERTEHAFLMYLSGSDSRSDYLETSKSDVNILAAVNPDTKQVLLVNTPRDFFVPNSASETGALDKLTHCGIYGVDCSMNALSGLYDQKIDYYARINFAGFEALIDALGGVTVYSDFEFAGGNTYFNAGANELNGERALIFARTRHAFADQDLQRGKNQMKLIEAVIAKATSSTALITNYSAIMDSLQGLFATNVPRPVIEYLVKLQLDEMPDWNIRTYAVNGEGDMQHTYSTGDYNAYVIWPYEEDLARGHMLMEAVLTGELLTNELMTKPVA